MTPEASASAGVFCVCVFFVFFREGNKIRPPPRRHHGRFEVIPRMMKCQMVSAGWFLVFDVAMVLYPRGRVQQYCFLATASPSFCSRPWAPSCRFSRLFSCVRGLRDCFTFCTVLCLHPGPLLTFLSMLALIGMLNLYFPACPTPVTLQYAPVVFSCTTTTLRGAAVTTFLADGLVLIPPQEALANARASHNAAPAATSWAAMEKDKDRDEIRSLLFDMKHSISHGSKYDPPPRVDKLPLPKHHYEYEVRVFPFFCG